MTQYAKSWLAYSIGRRSRYVNISGYPLCMRLLVLAISRCNFRRAISCEDISSPACLASTISYVPKVLVTQNLLERKEVCSHLDANYTPSRSRPHFLQTTRRQVDPSCILSSGLLYIILCVVREFVMTPIVQLRCFHQRSRFKNNSRHLFMSALDMFTP